VDWTAIGQQMQRLHEERAQSPHRVPTPSARTPETSAQQSKLLAEHIADLRVRFADVVEAFNQGVTSHQLKLVVMGPGDPKFVVVRGSVSLAFEKTPTHILQVIQRHLHKLPETQKAYGVDPEGRLTPPSGEGTLAPGQIVDLGMWELLSMEDKALWKRA
jgi:hypothetical protein